MILDSNRGINTLLTEAFVLPSGPTAYFSVEAGGFPESGGVSVARQEGDQYVLRCLKTAYVAPAVHDKLVSTTYGTLEVKQIYAEGFCWALRVTGKVAGRRDI